MLTHRIYTQKKDKRLYFSGTYAGTANDKGQLEVNWEWSYSETEARVFYTPDAWDLLFCARAMWPQATIEVERITTLERIVNEI